MKNNWVLPTSSAEKALNNSTVTGVGMLLSTKAYRSLNSVETNSPRIMIASFNRNLAVTMTYCYSPTNVSHEDDKDQFYFDLTTALRLAKRMPGLAKRMPDALYITMLQIKMERLLELHARMQNASTKY